MRTPEHSVGSIEIPPSAEVRRQLRQRAAATNWNEFPSPLRQSQLADLSSQILSEEGCSAAFRNWFMVVLASNFWRDAVAAVPFHRRLLLLPRSDDSQAESNGGASRLSALKNWRSVAEGLGYRIADSTQFANVEKSIRAGEIDAVVGISDLRGLEKAVEQVMTWGVPCMAEPLPEDNSADDGSAANTLDSVDIEHVERMLRLSHRLQRTGGHDYLGLIRESRELFRYDNLVRLMPRESAAFRFNWAAGSESIESSTRAKNGENVASEWFKVEGESDFLRGTAAIAFDFLSRGGKYFRPFITLASYQAVASETGGSHSRSSGSDFSDGVKRTAISIEVFHKASLVHDDIEDNDDYRYGEPAVHRRYGIPTAINVGDYLVGLGYRLVSSSKPELGGDTVADILDCLAHAHQRLSEGQGAELLWRDSPSKLLTPEDALQIYALKTAPAFEVAFYAGLRLAGRVGVESKFVRAFAEYLGVAFQILNDLQDWCENESNKVQVGGDVLHGRPTLLWALALQAANFEQHKTLMSLVASDDLRSGTSRIDEVRDLYRNLGVFQAAAGIIEKLESQAAHCIDQFQSPQLRHLLRYLMEVVLQRPEGLNQVLSFSSEAA
ncbi:MAG: polyprenyl synthetase family protein [Planctomycetaceae bacterium]|nr:polyprenyl synthetase family protein [Planctomycetaceae bacterium]